MLDALIYVGTIAGLGLILLVLVELFARWLEWLYDRMGAEAPRDMLIIRQEAKITHEQEERRLATGP